MPIKSSDLERCRYHRLLVIGPPKVGKTTTIISTCDAPAYVINCDDRFALEPARRLVDFECDHVLEPSIFQKMENAIKAARDGVREGRYKTIIWDTMSAYSETTIELMLDSVNQDGRRAYPDHMRKMRGILLRLFTVDAHVIVTAHYERESGQSIPGQVEKTGEGICPGLAGKERFKIPGMFQDVVQLEKRNGERVFVTSDSGVWGPGCRGLPGLEVVPANVSELWKRMQSDKKPVATKEKRK